MPAPSDGVLPEGFFSTPDLSTYVKVGGAWRLPREPRMDEGLVVDADGVRWADEGRRLRQRDRVAVGSAEDGSEGIFVHENRFVSATLAGNAVAVHDIEASMYGTTLGRLGTGEATSDGHGLHMRAINKIRAAGSIALLHGLGNGAGHRHQWRHARLRTAPGAIRAVRGPFATTDRCPRSTPTRSRRRTPCGSTPSGRP